METTVNGLCGGQHLAKSSVDGFTERGLFLERFCHDGRGSTLHFFRLLGPDW